MGVRTVPICDVTIEELDKLLEEGEFFNARGDLLSHITTDMYTREKRDNWIGIKEFADSVGYRKKHKKVLESLNR